MHEYFYEQAAKDRFAELRAVAERSKLMRALRPTRPALRVALGTGLIRLGRWVRGRLDEPRRPVAERVGAHPRS